MAGVAWLDPGNPSYLHWDQTGIFDKGFVAGHRLIGAIDPLSPESIIKAASGVHMWPVIIRVLSSRVGTVADTSDTK